MARVREFDPDQALEKAMGLFWQKGYRETSMRDLVAHTGVAHAGLYAAFGGKRRLFQAVLERYGKTVISGLLRGLESPQSGRAEVEQCFHGLLDAAKRGAMGNGCLMCNTAIEFGDEAGEIRATVNRSSERMVEAFHGALGRARDRGQVPADLDPAATAEFMVTVLHGLVVLVRAKAPPERIRRTVRVALGVLD